MTCSGGSAVIEAMDLLVTGQCTARCLLAMETPPGWPGCRCACSGLFYASLIGAAVSPVLVAS